MSPDPEIYFTTDPLREYVADLRRSLEGIATAFGKMPGMMAMGAATHAAIEEHYRAQQLSTAKDVQLDRIADLIGVSRNEVAVAAMQLENANVSARRGLEEFAARFPQIASLTPRR